MTMTNEQMLFAITRELVRTEIAITKQNPEMALGIAMARRIMERQYADKMTEGNAFPSVNANNSQP